MYVHRERYTCVKIDPVGRTNDLWHGLCYKPCRVDKGRLSRSTIKNEILHLYPENYIRATNVQNVLHTHPVILIRLFFRNSDMFLATHSTGSTRHADFLFSRTRPRHTTLHGGPVLVFSSKITITPPVFNGTILKKQSTANTMMGCIFDVFAANIDNIGSKFRNLVVIVTRTSCWLYKFKNVNSSRPLSSIRAKNNNTRIIVR